LRVKVQYIKSRSH